MLDAIGVPSLDALIDQTIPPDIRADGAARPARRREPSTPTSAGCARIAAREPSSPGPTSAWATTTRITPTVILRNVFENPGWYTPYTPYQAEIAQGRLESLLNFQTMVQRSDGDGHRERVAARRGDGRRRGDGDVPSRADEADARRQRERVPRRRTRASRRRSTCCSGRAEPLGIRLEIGDPARLSDESLGRVFGVLLQYPDDRGEVARSRGRSSSARTPPACSSRSRTDLLALTLMTPPGEMGADVVVGNSQRFGVPLGYGGPHAAFFATREAYVRQAPGRIIGVSVDAQRPPAYRMALQTREQHIRREKATSNICTAQALLANMAAMYAVYHGPDGPARDRARACTSMAGAARAAR